MIDTEKKPTKKIHLLIPGLLLVTLALAAAFIGVPRLTAAPHLKSPTVDHYHMRTQILVEGEAVDFSGEAFQEEYEKGSCSAELPATPVHFHDGVDQLTHIHWDGITGGEVLKYYGWNLIGGPDDSLGKRYDESKIFGKDVPIHGMSLPEIKDDQTMFVYTGDDEGFDKRELEDFLNQDFEEFFGVDSLLNPREDSSSLWDSFFPTAHAHSEEEEELKQINNLLGNVVIFAQDTEPSDKEITARFNMLVPLTDSVCGG